MIEKNPPRYKYLISSPTSYKYYTNKQHFLIIIKQKYNESFLNNTWTNECHNGYFLITNSYF